MCNKFLTLTALKHSKYFISFSLVKLYKISYGNRKEGRSYIGEAPDLNSKSVKSLMSLFASDTW